ncbi:MAG: GIY-YIG nuclease family protein, partial [Methanoregulaceae archaeon]|nr:GIY-YIG nuclease family protein [Methanoregulaceae archaeon]
MIDLTAVPSDPGCYLFLDPDGNVIYVGKAKNLKRRVSSYFKRHDRDQKTVRLAGTASSVNFIATTSEVEALILENTLIKRYQPKFNIDLKDSKSYAYILLTGEEFPCLRMSRRTGNDGTYFGPFVSAAERDYVFSVVKKTFRLRTCRKLPKRGCLRRHMESCSAPCRGGVSPEEYRDQVRKASLVLRGKSEEFRAALTAEMEKSAKEQAFE